MKSDYSCSLKDDIAQVVSLIEVLKVSGFVAKMHIEMLLDEVKDVQRNPIGSINRINGIVTHIDCLSNGKGAFSLEQTNVLKDIKLKVMHLYEVLNDEC